MIGGDLELSGRSAFDGHLDAPLALVSIPDAVIETELDFLLHATGEIVGHHPARMDIKSRLPPIGVGVDNLKLNRVPSRAVRRSNQAAGR